jgi:hypothetical protein
VPILAGALATYYGKNKYVKELGKGVIGAALVSAGQDIAYMIGGTAAGGKVPGLQFSGVKAFPVSGVRLSKPYKGDFDMGASRLSQAENPASSADFGGIPQVMGEIPRMGAYTPDFRDHRADFSSPAIGRGSLADHGEQGYEASSDSDPEREDAENDAQLG